MQSLCFLVWRICRASCSSLVDGRGYLRNSLRGVREIAQRQIRRRRFAFGHEYDLPRRRRPDCRRFAGRLKRWRLGSFKHRAGQVAFGVSHLAFRAHKDSSRSRSRPRFLVRPRGKCTRGLFAMRYRPCHMRATKCLFSSPKLIGIQRRAWADWQLATELSKPPCLCPSGHKER